METLIVTEKGNETINSGIRFRVIHSTLNKYRRDHITFTSYAKAKDRMDTLKSIFKANEWRWEIVIEEVIPNEVCARDVVHQGHFRVSHVR